jgi:hypothetical protein
MLVLRNLAELCSACSGVCVKRESLVRETCLISGAIILWKLFPYAAYLVPGRENLPCCTYCGKPFISEEYTEDRHNSFQNSLNPP